MPPDDVGDRWRTQGIYMYKNQFILGCSTRVAIEVDGLGNLGREEIHTEHIAIRTFSQHAIKRD